MDEVSLDIVVRDRHGRPLTDLDAGEIRLLDDGAPVKINTLRLVRGTTAPDRAGALREARLVSIVFDRLATYSSRIARQAALEMIKTAGGPNVYFSVWQIGTSLQLRQQFTTDESILKNAIDLATFADRKTTGQSISREVLRDFGSTPQTEAALTNGSTASLSASGSGNAVLDAASKKIGAITTQIMDRSAEMSREVSARPSIHGLLALVKGQATLAGRKTILYFSDGFQVTSDAKDYFQSLIGTANRSGVSIYTLETAGVSGSALSDASQIAMSMGGLGVNSTNPSSGPGARMSNGDLRSLRNLDSNVFSNQRSPMIELANSTGGIYVGGSNDLRKSIRRIAEDLSTYYEVAYSPHISDYDGHFRKITVDVSRPHVKVQSRSGYFSLPSIAGSSVEPFEAPLLKLLGSTPRTEGFPFRASVLRFGDNGESSRASLVVEVRLDGVTHQTTEDGERHKVRLSLVALVRGNDGRVIRKLSQDVAFQGALDRTEESRSGFFTFQRPFNVPPGRYRIDVAVADQFGAKVSIKAVECELPKAPEGLNLSDLAVVRRLELFERNQSSTDLLQYSGRRVVPDLTFDSAAKVTSDIPVFFAIYPDPKSSEKPQVELELIKDKQVVGTVPMEVPDASAGSPLTFVTSIRSAALPGGSYQLVARAKQAGTTREQQMAFVVEGKPSTASSTEASVAQPKTDFLGTTKFLEDAQRPDQQRIKEILASARQRALDYTNELPNFICMQVTRRSVDPSGRTNWKYRDTLTNLLRFIDGTEQTDLLEVNGQRAVGTNVGGIALSGEFGGLLGMVFSEEAKPEVEWQGMADISGGKAHVLRLHVAEKNSGYGIVGGVRGPFLKAAYTATVYIDAITMVVRRITIEAENLPSKFPIQESLVAIDYDYVPLSGRDYLLPQQAMLFVREGAHYLKRNEIKFLNYRKFGAESTFKAY